MAQVYLVMKNDHEAPSDFPDEVMNAFAKKSVAEAYAKRLEKEEDNSDFEFYVQTLTLHTSLAKL